MRRILIIGLGLFALLPVAFCASFLVACDVDVVAGQFVVCELARLSIILIESKIIWIKLHLEELECCSQC